MSFDLKIVRGDISIGSSGDVETVFDNNKLRQDIIKIMLTNLGENKYHPQYGSRVGALELGFVPDQSLVEADLTSSAEEAIRYLIRAQRTQQQRQYLTPGEVITGIKEVRVERDRLDPRMYNIFISVYTKKLTVLSELIPVRVL